MLHIFHTVCLGKPIAKSETTLKSLIEEHAHLDFSDFLSFSCNKRKIPPCSFIYLLSKKAGRSMIPPIRAPRNLSDAKTKNN